MVPPDVPSGHPLYGKPVGSRYDVGFGRWPGNNPAFDRLPQPAQVAGILAHEDFPGFYRAIEAEPTIVESAVPAAKQALETLERRFPGNPDVQTIVEDLKRSPEELAATAAQDPDPTVKVLDAAFGVGYLATAEAAKPQPDQELITTVKTAGAAVISPPHVILHLWAGGVDPTNPTVRGTVSNFNELTVDPLFWMIHTEVDRWWYTWEQGHTGLPRSPARTRSSSRSAPSRAPGTGAAVATSSPTWPPPSVSPTATPNSSKAGPRRAPEHLTWAFGGDEGTRTLDPLLAKQVL